MKQKVLFITFKGLSIVKNRLRPETPGRLSHLKVVNLVKQQSILAAIAFSESFNIRIEQ